MKPWPTRSNEWSRPISICTIKIHIYIRKQCILIKMIFYSTFTLEHENRNISTGASRCHLVEGLEPTDFEGAVSTWGAKSVWSRGLARRPLSLYYIFTLKKTEKKVLFPLLMKIFWKKLFQKYKLFDLIVEFSFPSSTSLLLSALSLPAVVDRCQGKSRLLVMLYSRHLGWDEKKNSF